MCLGRNILLLRHVASFIQTQRLGAYHTLVHCLPCRHDRQHLAVGHERLERGVVALLGVLRTQQKPMKGSGNGHDLVTGVVPGYRRQIQFQGFLQESGRNSVRAKHARKVYRKYLAILTIAENIAIRERLLAFRLAEPNDERNNIYNIPCQLQGASTC